MQDAQEQISQKTTQGYKGDRHLYPDAAEDQKLPILTEKENVPPTGTFVYCTIKKYT